MTHDQLTVGVVTPHAAPGPEVELPAITLGRVKTVVCRIGPPEWPPEVSPLPPQTPSPVRAELRASTRLAAIDRAAVVFDGLALTAVAHASTTSGYVIGHRAEAVLVERLSQRFQVPAVASCGAAVEALRVHGVGVVQLVHPPWFDDGFDELGASFFRNQGFGVVVTRAGGLPDNPAQVTPQHVVDWVEHHVADRAEALFLAGNGFRTVGAVDELETRTGRLVLGANQALLWGVLTATSTAWDITGHGRLMRADTPTT